MSDARLAGIAAVTTTAVLWGTTGTAATFAPDAGPLAIGAAALGIGGLLQALVAVPALRAAVVQLRTQAGTVLLGAVAVFVYPLAFYSSMHLAGVAVGSVISLASAPLAAGVLERVVDGRRLGRWWAAAATTGVVASVLLCLSSFTTASSATPIGIGLGLLAGAAYAGYSWAAHRLMSRGVARSAAMGSVFGGGGLLLLPVLVITGGPLIASTTSFAVAAYMALIPMFLGYLLFGFGLTKVSPTVATTITLTEPAVATVLAVIVVGESLSATSWVGLGLFAVVLAMLAVAPSPPEPADELRDAAKSRSVPNPDAAALP
ncbi:DMT family transporter [Gordonia hydrophobica]|uniref:EamA family transporter n=1 Tax=Gordonia hydrophobica TaxID=40516 RepID=A0ABZ2TXV5_9ACTN|nr:EamA family transporter [Gordonia hydrophobica]MBM7366391.1 DME family drug/metabolite transporter [Gordonia hydrophobica]